MAKQKKEQDMIPATPDGNIKEEVLDANKIPTINLPDRKDGTRRFRVQFDISWKHPGVTPEGVSETVPDLTMSLGTLLERHSRGQAVPYQEPVYFETEVPTFNDITDVDRYYEQLKNRTQEVGQFLQEELEDNQKRIDKEEAEKAELQEVNEEIKKRKQAKTRHAGKQVDLYDVPGVTPQK